MKQLLILVFSISFLSTFKSFAQQDIDTIAIKEKYGIRIGIDLITPTTSLFENETKGLEFVGDIRFLRNYFAAVEFGFNEKTTDEDYMNFTTKGSYIKIGVNYNAYQNWKGMQNEIYIGLRYGMSFFDHTLNSYTPNVEGTYFITDPLEPSTEFNSLTAQWAELVFGIKAETLKNLYLGLGLRFNRMVSTKEPENFKNLYVPGFNRVFSNNVGVGFNYSLSYFIPLIKKSK